MLYVMRVLYFLLYVLCMLCCGAGVVSYIVLYVMLRHYCNACVVLYVSYVLSCMVCIVGHGVAFIVRIVFFIALTAVLCFGLYCGLS